MKNVYLKFLGMAETAACQVIATVTATKGSTPQKPGSSAFFNDGKLVDGTVGGGIVEMRVQESAKNACMNGRSRYLHLTLNHDISRKEEAICGGEISILLDANPSAALQVFNEMKRSLAAREPGVLITMVTEFSEDQVLINRYWMTRKKIPALPEKFLEKIVPETIHILTSADPGGFRKLELGIPDEEPASLFLMEPVFPLPRLIITGAGHIGKAMSRLGKMLDFEVTVIDDRADFANPENLPDADHIIVKDVGDAMNDIVRDQDTFIVIVTRGHSDDAAALKPCIGSHAAYVGMIGSRPKIARMKAEFISQVWATEEQWAQIHAPIGLDINSKTVEEIAVSIAAELVMVKNRKN